MKEKRKMDKKKIFGAIGIIAGLAVVFFALVKGPCTGTIATAAGGAVPMKCHWSFRATAPFIKTAAAVGGASQVLVLVFSRDSKPSKRF